MALIRVFSKVDEEGRILIPSNVRREVGLKPDQLVEIKVGGAHKAPSIVIHKRKEAR